MTQSPEPMIQAAAAAIANARGGRRGMPPVANILDMLPRKLVDEVTEDASAALLAADEAEWRPMTEAPKDGSAVLGFGIHTGSPPDAQRGVQPGDHWWSIMLWDIWRSRENGGDRWVFAKDGAPVWSEPLRFKLLRVPPGVLP